MRVLHLSSEKTWRGGEQQIAYLVGELKNQGVDCHVICRKASAFSKFCAEQGWTFQEVGFKNSLDILSALKVLKYCRKHQIDLVHMHGSGSHGVGVLSATMGNKSKLVLSRRVDFPLKNNILSRWKYNHPSIKRILCVSNKIKEIVEKSVDNKGICRTVYSGIDLEKFSQAPVSNFLRKKYNLDEQAKLIGNTSAIADHKDYVTFVDTAEEVLKRQENVYFFIFGAGPLLQEVKDYIEQKGLSERIIFTGFINNIPEVLPELDVFLMTSKTEGLGTSLLDAMAASVPIVATEAGGIPEIVINGNTGLTAKVKDYITLSNHIVSLINDWELRSKLVANATKFVLKFDKKETAKKTLDIYNEIFS
ncbi:glycosyltransferase family 4 protein [Reichenbachiella sp. MALMAid0571]|uniref:glycosyltransferase family 4 protein n=1 Tax=Reichenbachiella sp. MALMAid0571 TaxID=3143939 RepID=UPI0032DF5D41